METALVTGMLETEFLPVKQAKMDVKESNTESFSAVFESSLKKNDVVENKEVKNTNDEQVEIENDTCENTKDVEDITDEGNTDKIKTDENKKDKKSKKDNFNLENQFFEVIEKDVEIKKDEINFQDVVMNDVDIKSEEVIKLVGSVNDGELTITPEEKLDNLLNKLDVKLTTNVKIKDDGENVIEVGPQSVETEKIELNTKEVEKETIENNIQEEVFISKEVNNNPEIQNPFKIKKSTENLEINEKENLNMENVETEKDNFKIDLSEEVSKMEVIEKEVVEKENINKKDVQIKDDVNEDDVSDIFENHDDEGNVIYQNDFDEYNDEHNSNEDTNKKNDKIKIRDFRNKNEVDFSKENFELKDVELENKLEIKDVNNVNRFQNLVFEQDVMDQVTEKLEVSLFDNKSEMVIKLKPNDLGNVTVKISIENGVMNAKFLADSMKVKEALESNLNDLKETLKEQGLNVQDLNVSVDSGRSQNQAFEQNNIRFLNNRKDYKVDNSVSYEDTYYEFSNNDINNNVRNYWMDSTVSFLA